MLIFSSNIHQRYLDDERGSQRTVSFLFRQPFDEKMMNVYYAAGQRIMPSVHRIIVFIGHHWFHGNTAHPHSEKTGNRSLPARKARTATTDAAQGIIGLPVDSRMSVSDISGDIEAWRKLQELRSMPNGENGSIPKPLAPHSPNRREESRWSIYSIHSKLR